MQSQQITYFKKLTNIISTTKIKKNNVLFCIPLPDDKQFLDISYKENRRIIQSFFLYE